MKNINPSREDCIRMAAFLDCEGHIGIRFMRRNNPKRQSGFTLDVTVANTDPRMTDWCSRVFGGKAHVTKISRSYVGAKPLYEWRAYSAHAEAVIRHCYEFFLIKREQADIALAFRATVSVHRRGQGKLAQDVQDKRAVLFQQMKDLRKRPHLVAS